MLLNLISLYFFISIVIGVFLSMYLLTNTKSIYSLILALLNICVIIYIFGYMMELHSRSLEEVLFWSRFEYIGLPFINATWLFLGILYSKHNKKHLKKIFIVIYIIPLLTFFARMTNSLHLLYYKDYALINQFDFYVLRIDKGLWYMVQSAYIGITTITIIVIYYFTYHKSSLEERKMFRKLSIATIIPAIGLVLQIVNIGDLSLDYTAFLLPVAIVFVTIAIVANDFLEVKSLARNEIFMKSNDALCVISRNNRIIDYNDKASEIFNLQGIDISKVSFTEDIESSEFLFLISKGEKTSQLYSNGKDRYWEIESQIMKKKDTITGRIVKITDETHKIQTQNYLKHLAITDPLSDLKNRREFMRVGEQHINSCRINKINLSLLMMDIDHFKHVNDTYGHQEGDKVIQSISEILKDSFRSTDIVSRFGGEEFVVLLTNVHEKEVNKIADEFRKRVEVHRFVNLDVDFRITVSIGIAIAEETDDLNNLILKADKSLYKAKETGRNKVVQWISTKK